MTVQQLRDILATCDPNAIIRVYSTEDDHGNVKGHPIGWAGTEISGFVTVQPDYHKHVMDDGTVTE